MSALGIFNSFEWAHPGASLAGLPDQPELVLLHSLAVPHVGVIKLTLLTAGMLWTAVDVPATSGRLTGRRLLAAVGCAVLVAAGSLVALALGVGLFNSELSPGGLLAVAALIAVCCLGVIAAVLGWSGLARGGIRRKAVLLVGSSCDLPEIGTRLAQGYGPAFVVAGVIPLGDRGDLEARSLRSRGIWGIVAAEKVILADAELRKRCRRDKIRLLGEAEFRERWVRRVDIDSLRSGALAANLGPKDSQVAKLTRRTGDIVVSTLLLVCALPFGALVAAFIKFDSRGPVFSAQERVGLNGRLFRLVMFRSTRVGCESGWGQQRIDDADSRPTRVGNLLRRTRIDELPQLWNVLRGEMSMVGPRPERPHSVAQLAAKLPCYNDRTLVKPGITGWAQLNCRYHGNAGDDRAQLAYDLYYVKHRSVPLDLRILATTIGAALFHEGAR